MNKSDSEKMIMLAREGKGIAKIQQQDFTQYSYEEIYSEVYGAGARAAQGAMTMITNRVIKLKKHGINAQQTIWLDEINDLADYLYRGFKNNQSKLEKIRKALE